MCRAEISAALGGRALFEKEVLGFAIAAALALLTAATTWWCVRSLQNPAATPSIAVEQLRALAQLSGVGTWMITIYRQGGIIESRKEVAGDAGYAIGLATDRMERARIRMITITANTPAKLEFSRPPSEGQTGRGRQVSGAAIELMGR